MEEKIEEKIDRRAEYERAKAEYEAAKAKSEAEKKDAIEKKLESLSKEEQAMVNEDLSTKIGGVGNVGRFFIFLLFMGISLALWFTKIQETEKITFLSFLLIVTVASGILTAAMTYLLNKNARAREKRIAEIRSNPNVEEFFNYCDEVQRRPDPEVEAAAARYDEAMENLFYDENANTVFIYAPATRAENTITLYKKLSLFVDGALYREALPTGLTSIKVTPGYHNFRFEEHESPKNSGGLLAAGREGRYGSANTVAEFTVQIDMNNSIPSGILLEKKNTHVIYQDLKFDVYLELFDF